MKVNLRSIRGEHTYFENLDGKMKVSELRVLANKTFAATGKAVKFLIHGGKTIDDDQILEDLHKKGKETDELIIHYTSKPLGGIIEVECNVLIPGMDKKMLVFQLPPNASVHDLSLAVFKHPQVEVDTEENFAVISCNGKQLPDARRLLGSGEPEIPSQQKTDAATNKKILVLGPIVVAFAKNNLVEFKVQHVGKAAAFQIKVKQSQPGKIDVNSIKQAVQKAHPGAPVDRQRLIFSGKELQNNKTCDSSEIANATIYLVIKPKAVNYTTGYIRPIANKPLRGETIIYQPKNRDETVYDMREFIAKELKCEPGQIRLIFGGRSLENDNQRLADAVPDNQRDSNVYVVRKMKRPLGQAQASSHNSQYSQQYNSYSQNNSGLVSNYIPHTSSPYAKKGLVGIRNLGNTCYMNAILQCLLQAPPLVKASLDREYKNPVGPAQQFMQFCKLCWQGSYSVMVPTRLKYQVATKAAQFHGFQQQDCFEFLNVLLEFLEKEPTIGAAIKGAGAAAKNPAVGGGAAAAPAAASGKAAPAPTSKKDILKTQIDRYHDFSNSESDPQRDRNLRFYHGHQPMLGTPFLDVNVDQLLGKGPSAELFMNKMCLPWLFPLPDGQPNENDECQPLQRHEADIIKKDDALRDRVLRMFGMLLEFFGMKIFYQNATISRRESEFKKGYEQLFTPQGLDTMTRALMVH